MKSMLKDSSLGIYIIVETIPSCEISLKLDDNHKASITGSKSLSLIMNILIYISGMA